MKPPPPRRALRSAGLGGHARVRPRKSFAKRHPEGKASGSTFAKVLAALAGTVAGAKITGPAGVSELAAGSISGGERERGVWR